MFVTHRFISKTIIRQGTAWLLVVLLLASGAAVAEDRDLPVVVLDPGHGGHDTGAAGVDGTLEKDINLAVARMVRDCLAGTCRVALTRTGDYRLDSADRTATANQLDADLFVSIHTGGDFSHISEGIIISYLVDAQAGTEKRLPDQRTCVDWDSAHAPYLGESREMAALLQDATSNILRRHSIVQAARVLVLEGAQMPAVLVETGYVTNPASEQQLQDNRHLAAIADCICTAIDRYLKARFRQ